MVDGIVSSCRTLRITRQSSPNFLCMLTEAMARSSDGVAIG